MPEQRDLSPEPRDPRAVPWVSSSPPVSVAGCDPRIDDYLDHLYAPLVGRVPYEVRQQFRSELQTHLEALVAAREEVGASHEQAVREALTQFGDPRLVA